MTPIGDILLKLLISQDSPLTTKKFNGESFSTQELLIMQTCLLRNIIGAVIVDLSKFIEDDIILQDLLNLLRIT